MTSRDVGDVQAPDLEYQSSKIRAINGPLDDSRSDTLPPIHPSTPDPSGDKAWDEPEAPGGIEKTEKLTPPPLPPRLPSLQKSDSFIGLRNPNRPQLLPKATTALSLKDVHTQSRGYARHDITSSAGAGTGSSNVGLHVSRGGSEIDDTASVKSYAPTLEANGDLESLLGEVVAEEQSPAWRVMNDRAEIKDPFEDLVPEDVEFETALHHEFDNLGEVASDGSNEEALMIEWKSRLKHFLILSSAGKPIYSRHGDDQLISHYVGVMQTIISFYQDANDNLRSFTAGAVRFVILSKGPLYLIAISRLEESDSQLRAQLEALYMQILSTLTLPNMERMFAQRPSTDLRTPLQGTEALLSVLADSFIRGSPSTLLSALECLKLRKYHRHEINNCLLKVKCSSLLYGLIVAGGRLVSVVRPRKHSLHPGDLQLIFNMLFEAGGVKAGGGENWIPLCLPGFNNTGYVYMYVSFLNASSSEQESSSQTATFADRENEIAIIFISANKEGFFELKHMRDELIEQLERTGKLKIIKSAVRKGRPSVTDIVSGTPLRHFLYKSKGNVQFVMPSLEPHFHGLIARRRLMSLYHTLHANVHAKTSHLKVQHCVSEESVSLAWVTPIFELYCVASPNTSRSALAQGANKIIQWVRREEERIFIIGGAVF